MTIETFAQIPIGAIVYHVPTQQYFQIIGPKEVAQDTAWYPVRRADVLRESDCATWVLCTETMIPPHLQTAAKEGTEHDTLDDCEPGEEG